jgi:hypothetical protein
MQTILCLIVLGNGLQVLQVGLQVYFLCLKNLKGLDCTQFLSLDALRNRFSGKRLRFFCQFELLTGGK